MNWGVKVKPEFIFVGPHKSGTTWIDNYLRSRGDVQLPIAMKETFFFDKLYDNGWDWYSGLYGERKPEHKICVEVAPSLLDKPEAIERVAKDLPDVTIIATLRNPIDRGIAHYFHYLKGGEPDRGFKWMCDNHHAIVSNGLYYRNLQWWADAIGPDRIKLLDYHDLNRDPLDYVRQICAVLGIPMIEPSDDVLYARINEDGHPKLRYLAKAARTGSRMLRLAGAHWLVNAFGGRWFDMDWQPQLDSEEWNNAITYYVDLVSNYGPPGASSNGHNENRALFKDGKCATWVDATSAATDVKNPDTSTVADVTDFFKAPKQVTDKGTGWFWSWALAIPASSQSKDTAKDFLKWATSKEYFELVGETKGWVAVPSGTRQSVEADPRRLEAAPFASTIVDAILSVDPADPTLEPVPYTGVQFVAIPEFQGIGNYVGQQISAALAGQQSVEEALANSQTFAVREMTKAGYIK